ncbi:MAG: hypothetical protein KF799_05200 [Bdellovibrionales bacterium]|nr:hypothetical protein [Bdellovibrionales bacterium]
MLKFPPANAMEILSANAQIFGALLGLVGLAFVRVVEAKERNVGQLTEGLGYDFTREMKVLEKDPATASLNVHISSMADFGRALETLKARIHADKYSRMRSRYDALLNEIEDMRKIKRRFLRNCWLSATLIMASIGGLLVPFEDYQGTMSYYLVVLLITAAVGLVQCVLFFMNIADTNTFFTYSSED